MILFYSFNFFNIAELTTCVCVSPDLAEKLLDLKTDKLKHIILIQSTESTLKNLREKAERRVQIHDFADILVSCVCGRLYAANFDWLLSCLDPPPSMRSRWSPDLHRVYFDANTRSYWYTCVFLFRLKAKKIHGPLMYVAFLQFSFNVHVLLIL